MHFLSIHAYRLLAGVALGLFGVGPAVGQDVPAAPAVTVPQIQYVNAEGKFVANAENADHREEQVYRDSVGGTIRIYYPSGKLRRMVPYINFKKGLRYGAETSFYETGEVKSRCVHSLRGPVGYYTNYYRSGQVRSRLPVGIDLPLDAKGEAFGPDGQPFTAEQAVSTDKMPTLKNGDQHLVVAVQKALRYPAAALRAQAVGQVLVSFMVDDQGFVRDAQIVSSPSPLLSPAVLEAVAALGRLSPGQQAGETVDVFCMLPITFSIH